MSKLVVIGDKRIKVGDKLRSNERAYENGICKPGIIVTVSVIKSVGEDMIGLSSTSRMTGWGSLDGFVSPKQGYWVNRDSLMDNFELITNDHVVSADITFKKHSIKGMRCKILHTDTRTMYSFIEVEKNVGGGSADGLGRSGHCIAIPHKALQRKPIMRSKKREKTTTRILADEYVESWFNEEEDHE